MLLISPACIRESLLIYWMILVVFLPYKTVSLAIVSVYEDVLFLTLVFAFLCYAALFNCTPVHRASDSMMARPKAIHFSWLGPELSSVAWSTGAQLIVFFCFGFSVVLFDRPGISIRHTTHCICRVLVLLLHSYLT